MAENTTLNLGTGGDLIATDELTTLNGAAAAAGLKVQRVKVGFGTDNSLRDVDANNPFPTTVVDVTATGTLAAAAQTVVISMAGGLSAATVQITGTWVGTITFEGTVNGTDWSAINGVYAGTSFPSSTITANGLVRLTPAGLASMRVHMTAFTSGSATIAMRASDGVGGVFANQILPVRQLENGLISTANSTVVALGIGGVFTGTAEDVTEYADIRVSVFSDQISATDGLQIQQSVNGTNWDLVDPCGIPAASGKIFSIAAAAKFYRVVYTNGATAQTAFRLQTKLHKTYSKGSSVRPQDARTNDNDFEEMLAFSMGYNGTTWDRLRSTITNGLAVDVTRLPATPTGANTIGAVTGPAAAPLSLDATQTNHTQRLQAVTTLTTISAANTAVTLTLPAVAAQFHYITRISISMHNTSAAAVVGSAVTLAFTSSNIPGAVAWTEGNALAAGISKLVCDESLVSPIRSSVVNTATTIVAPACGAGVLVRLTAYYYTAV